MNVGRATQRVALSVFVLVTLATHPAVPLQAAEGHGAVGVRPDEPTWLKRLKTWSEAVTHHVPGQADAAVQDLATWTADDVKTVVADFQAMLDQVHRAARYGSKLEVEHKKIRLTTDDLSMMAVFREPGPGAVNRIVRRAAMLHADVALLAPLDFSRSTATPDTVKVMDGVIVGYEGQSAHWSAGRQALDAVEPEPAGDAFVRLWYHAIAAGFLEDGNLSAAKPHLEHAVDVLPADANVQYEYGCYHQVTSSPPIRAVLVMQERTAARSSRTSHFGVAGGGSVESHLKAAEQRFRQAVTLDPSHTEARTRLGLALLNLNRVEDAAVQLRQVVVANPDAVLSYISRMLLGQAEERLGHRQEALKCYDQAAVLFPEAGSPKFARAALDRTDGNRSDAWQAVERVIEPPVLQQMDVDPWWALYRWQLKSAKVLLAELRAMALAEGGL